MMLVWWVGTEVGGAVWVGSCRHMAASSIPKSLYENRSPPSFRTGSNPRIRRLRRFRIQEGKQASWHPGRSGDGDLTPIDIIS